MIFRCNICLYVYYNIQCFSLSFIQSSSYLSVTAYVYIYVFVIRQGGEPINELSNSPTTLWPKTSIVTQSIPRTSLFFDTCKVDIWKMKIICWFKPYFIDWSNIVAITYIFSFFILRLSKPLTVSRSSCRVWAGASPLPNHRMSRLAEQPPTDCNRFRWEIQCSVQIQSLSSWHDQVHFDIIDKLLQVI